MKQIIRLDASCIKESSCFRRLYLIQQGYREKGLSSDIHYGTCFHKCAEVLEQTGDSFKAITAAQELWRAEEAKLYIKPTKKFLGLAHLTMACQMYAQQRLTNPIFTDIEYLRSPDGLPLVEQKMSIPLYEDEHLLILLQGTIDGIAKIKRGCIVIADWKTTSAYDVEDYFFGYALSPQLKTYYCGLNYYRTHYPNSHLGKLLNDSGQIGAFIYGAFLSAGDIVKFERSKPFWFNSKVMADYTAKLDELVSAIVANVKEGSPLPIADGSFNGACVGHRGDKCKFALACAAETNMNADESVVRHILNSNFKKVDYKPLEFGGGHKQKEKGKNEENIIGISTT